MRSSYQVLVFPYFKENDEYLFALFKREDLGFWQGIAGGGEDGELPLDSAKREAGEEGGIDKKSNFIKLTSFSTMPVVNVCGFKWGDDICIIPEFAFGVEVFSKNLLLSNEHLEFGWFNYDSAIKKLNWDSNKTALWELNYRLKNNKLDSNHNSKILKELCSKNIL